jgi:hypothetical protein
MKERAAIVAIRFQIMKERFTELLLLSFLPPNYERKIIYQNGLCGH